MFRFRAVQMLQPASSKAGYSRRINVKDFNNARKKLKGFYEVRGKHAGFFSKVLCADPIIGTNCIVRLAQKSFNFFRQIFLCRAELPSIGKL